MIRSATENDMERILEIYASAKTFMHSHGNPNQWNGAYPDRETLTGDIEKGNLFVLQEKGRVYGVFALIGGEDETYRYIDGAWRSESAYGTIHRIASDGTRRGVMKACFDFARKSFSHLRVDTHEDNKPMQSAVKRCGFEYAGVIYLADGSPRLAYDWLAKEQN